MSKRSGRIVDFFLPKQPRVEHTSSMSGNYSDSEASVYTDEGFIFHSEEVDQVPVSSQSGSNILQANQLDIGLYVSEKESVNADLRLELLVNCWAPPSNYIFPLIIQAARKRYFNRSWLLNYPWLVYSECSSGAFCKICVLFLDTNDKRVGKGRTQKVGSLVIQPFTD